MFLSYSSFIRSLACLLILGAAICAAQESPCSPPDYPPAKSENLSAWAGQLYVTDREAFLLVGDKDGLLATTLVSSQPEGASLSKRIAFARSYWVNKQGRRSGSIVIVTARRGCSRTWPTLIHELE